MANMFKDNEDLLFYVNHGIDWSSLIDVTEFEYGRPGGFADSREAVEFYRDVLDLLGDFAAREIAPHAAEIDRQGVTFADGEASFGARETDIFERIKELELYGMSLPRELGGSNCPMVVYFLATEIVARADVSVLTHYGFHGGMALALLNYSLLEGSTTFDRQNKVITSTRFEKEIGEILSGQAWGCMDITEPNAGSDMAALRTKARQDDQGNWLVTGEKIFITSGHGKYHLVIARTEKGADRDDPFAGLKGLSLFLVPAYEEDDQGRRTRLATLERVEEKLGHHGSVTASISFDDTPAQLIGQRGDGFKLMLSLMNGARIGVGFESIGVAEAAYRLADAYAQERPSMGKFIAHHEMIADYLDEMRTDLQGVRALAVYCAFHEEMAQKLRIKADYLTPDTAAEAKSLTQRRLHHQSLARQATPLLKYVAAEKAVDIARRCLQIHGGNGYSKEYGAEKLLRDALVMPIYEGTSQIQALMAMKDSLNGIISRPQAFLNQLAQAQWRARTATDARQRRVARIQLLLLQAQQHLISRTAADKLRWLPQQPLTQWPKAFFQDWNPKRDFAWAMLHAERLTQLQADALISQILLHQAQRHPQRAELLDRFLERAELRSRYVRDVIVGSGRRVLEQLQEAQAS
jgi:alkylation response protein AidB-like acyl-CoA dehydrogenase